MFELRTEFPSDSGAFAPTQVLAVDLERPLPPLGRSHDGNLYGHALLLARLHEVPLGIVEVELGDAGVTPQRLAQQIWIAVEPQIRAHLRADQLPEEVLSAGGYAHPSTPACAQERERFLQDAPALSVLIPTREHPERVGRCVESVLACHYPEHRLEVFVVDNAPSSDRTLELVSDVARESRVRVRYLREDVPGSASARNRGLAEVTTEIVAMTDDDVVVDRHWLTEIARAFGGSPAAAAVTGPLMPLELKTPAQVWFEQYGGFSRGFERRVFDLEQNRPRHEPLYPWNAGQFGTGNNFSFRTSALREMGGFDPALGNGTPALGGVDSEVLLRTILSGYQIVYEPHAIAHHQHRADYESLKRQVYAYGTGLMAYYLKTILARPEFALDFARRLPAGVRWMLSPEAHINRYKQEGYPGELNWIERRGMLYGAIGYARSRRRYGPHRPYARRPRLSGIGRCPALSVGGSSRWSAR